MATISADYVRCKRLLTVFLDMGDTVFFDFFVICQSCILAPLRPNFANRCDHCSDCLFACVSVSDVESRSGARGNILAGPLSEIFFSNCL